MKSDTPVPVSDAYLVQVYRDYPGLLALILRRVRDPEVAADILQDAALTTLQKLRGGEIAHLENVGGYLYRVALNHLRNYRRKDRTGVSSSAGLNELRVIEDDPEWQRVGRSQWAAAARRVLEEMPYARDRQLLVRFYLNDEAKEQICKDLRVSREHFTRIVFRARNRFKELLEQRGYSKADLLAILACTLCISKPTIAIFGPAGQAVAPAPLLMRAAGAVECRVVALMAPAVCAQSRALGIGAPG